MPDLGPAMLFGRAIPVPPADTVMPALPQLVFTLTMVATLLGTGIAAAIYSWRSREVFPLLCVTAGLGVTLIEPLLCHLGLLWYPEEGQLTLIEMMGRRIPIFSGFGYAWWYGAMIFLLAQRIQSATTVREGWMIYVFLLVLDLVMEETCLHLGLFYYYGDQGLRVIQFPIWWLFMNGAQTLLSAYALVHLRKYLTGPRIFLVIPLMPALCALGNAFHGFPSWLAINTPDKPWLLLPFTLLTCILALATTDWISRRLAEQRAPVWATLSSDARNP